MLFGIALFSATVLSLYWRLVLKQSDESLKALSITAVNVVGSELAEHASLEQAAREMESMVPRRDYVVSVMDASGVPTHEIAGGLPIVAITRSNAGAVFAETVTATTGQQWRVMRRTAQYHGHGFTVVVAAPMAEVLEHWWTLLRACAIGVPFVLTIAAVGGWIVGRRGLHPLAEIAAQARRITPRALDSRLIVANAGVELQDVATAFNRVLDQLGNALSTQRQFMADASHELRTPVSIMKTAADVTLSQDDRDPGEYRDAVGVMAQQSARLARLVDDMLVLARADGGGYPIKLDEVDVDVVVAEGIRELASRAAAKQIHLTSHVEPICVKADEALLRRMFGNLLANALIYTPDEGAVDVRVEAHDGGVRIHVADNGPSIPEADRERVFARFMRLDPARSAGGAGLGLPIARWIAEAHGGDVELLRTGPGSNVFRVTLPAQPPSL
jgi:two-component system OmpR family sensor kinase